MTLFVRDFDYQVVVLAEDCSPSDNPGRRLRLHRLGFTAEV